LPIFGHGHGHVPAEDRELFLTSWGVWGIDVRLKILKLLEDKKILLLVAFHHVQKNAVLSFMAYFPYFSQELTWGGV
jgi:hypothetical protein